MNSFALFRLPYEKKCTLVVQTSDSPKELLSCNELTGQQGFVMAPFASSAEHPILLIRADEVLENLESMDNLENLANLDGLETLATTLTADYHLDFANFHSHFNPTYW